jgi:hypothetical protein
MYTSLRPIASSLPCVVVVAKRITYYDPYGIYSSLAGFIALVEAQTWEGNRNIGG